MFTTRLLLILLTAFNFLLFVTVVDLGGMIAICVPNQG